MFLVLLVHSTHSTYYNDTTQKNKHFYNGQLQINLFIYIVTPVVAAGFEPATCDSIIAALPLSHATLII